MNTDYSTMKKEGKLFGTIKRAQELRRQRELNPPNPNVDRIRLKAKRVIVPLGSKTDSDLDRIGRTEYPKRQNWIANTPIARKGLPFVRSIDHGKYSRSCTYTHWQYSVTVGCYALPNATRCLFIYGVKSTLLTAPTGYIWQTDANGLVLISRDGKKDYHPDSDDLRNYSKAALRQKALDNYRQRVETKKAQKKELAGIRQAEKEGAKVCIADSIRAGNCATGTKAFAARHGLDPLRHYSPTSLLKIANGEAHRVKLAVAVALRRHRTEMKTGYCNLADHHA